MENPLKSFSQKDWIYLGGAIASVVALGLFVTYSNKSKTLIPSGTVTDTPNVQATPELSYINTNMPDLNEIVPTAIGADTAPNTTNTSTCGGCCDRAGNSNGYCTGTSGLSTGQTFSDTQALINYYQNTNPIYVQLQAVQLAKYAALFATGEEYSKGGTPLRVSYGE